MTQEQKQFIIKALESGIPAIAKEHIAALEEVAKVADAKQEDLNGQEQWNALNPVIHQNIINTVINSFPFMANEYAIAYTEAVRASQEKFDKNIKAREEKEKAEKEAAGKEEEKKSA